MQAWRPGVMQAGRHTCCVQAYGNCQLCSTAYVCSVLRADKQLPGKSGSLHPAQRAACAPHPSMEARKA